jgi:diguanylate cyclase (GGDEF)-like protein
MDSKPLPRLSAWWLGSDAHQRIRVAQTSIAWFLMAVSALALNYLAWVGIASPRPVLLWSACVLLAFGGFYGAIRSGHSLRYADPSLTVPQMCVAFVGSVAAYAIAGAGRGAMIPILMVILMFGMYSLAPRTVHRLALLAVLLIGATMGLMALLKPAVYEPKIEVGHFLMVGAMLGVVATLAGQLSRLRERLRRQKIDLSNALDRIQDLATRDELTGLVNRRQMQEVMQLEHQRCMRSGHAFCIAVIDLDHFKQINDSYGHPVGDEVLRAFAREALAAIRISDVMARWGGEEFLLLMSDTRGTLARLGIERLRERCEAMRPRVGNLTLAVTLSAGVTEHRAGESLADTIARADQALYAAKAAGRNRVVLH